MDIARDLAVIILAFLSVVLIILLLVLIFQIWSLVRLIRGEVTPILDSMRQTSSTVKGTAEFVSETTVYPLIRVASAAAAANRFVRALFGLTSRR